MILKKLYIAFSTERDNMYFVWPITAKAITGTNEKCQISAVTASAGKSHG